MIGYASQMIAPLAGDGIGMAMQCGKLMAESIEEGRRKNLRSEEIRNGILTNGIRLSCSVFGQPVLFRKYS